MKYFLHFVFMALMPLATIHCQILTKSFVLRLSDMAQVIEEQKKVIEDQNTSNDILKTKVDDLDQELDNLQIRINNLENPQSMFYSEFPQVLCFKSKRHNFCVVLLSKVINLVLGPLLGFATGLVNIERNWFRRESIK